MGDYEGTFIELSGRSLTWIDEQGEEDSNPISDKAAKALKKAQRGDRIQLQIEFENYTVVKAFLYTGSTEERLDKIEAALAAAGIEIPKG